MKYGIIIYRTGLVLLIACLFMGSCTNDPLAGTTGEDEVPGGEVNAVFTLRVPPNSVPSTRGMTAVQESAVGVVDVLVFGNNGTDEVLSQHVAVTQVDKVGSSGTDYQFRALLTPDAGASTVVVVANASTEVSAATGGNTGVTKKDFLEALVFENATKWGAEPIPMYGEITVTGISVGTTIETVRLTRMMARVDIFNLAKGDFELKNIYVANYNSAGYVAPPWNLTSGAITGILPDDPWVPAGAQVRSDGLATSSLAYPYTINTTDGMEREIYLFEAPKAAGSDLDESRLYAACLILEGVYKGSTWFYRVDFTDNLKDKNGRYPGDAGYIAPSPDEIRYMPLYRNHHYTVNIAKVEGNGYRTFKEALESNTVLSNLKSWVHSVNEDYDYIVYNGQYYLAVESKQVKYRWWETTRRDFRIRTNHPGGWKAQVTKNLAWINLVSDGQTQYTGDMNETTLPLILKEQYPNSTLKTGEGIITITAGRLSLTVEVDRNYITEYFATSNIIVVDHGLPGQRLVFATTREENGKYPANSQGLHFRFGSLVGLNCDSPVGGVDFGSGHVVFCPVEYNAPATWTWNLVPDYTGNSNVDDEFAHVYPESSGTLGYKADEGLGDICRYISDKGWVKGRWRLPTNNEFGLLINGSQFLEPTGPWVSHQTINTPGMYGIAPYVSGWWAGNSTETSITEPAEGTIFLPASGTRNKSNGRLQTQGTSGHYWHSAASGTPNGTHSLHISSNTINRAIYTLSAGSAYSVRCMRDYD